MATGLGSNYFGQPYFGGDAISIAYTLNLSDNVTTSDSIANSPRPTLSDNITTSDSIAKSAKPVISDSVTTSDVLTKIVTYNLSLSDSVTFSDAISSANPNQFDYYGRGEPFQYAKGKDITDTFGYYRRTEPLQGVVFPASNPSFLLTHTLSLSDNVNTTDITGSFAAVQTSAEQFGSASSLAVTVSPTGAYNLVVVHIRCGVANTVTSVIDDKGNTYIVGSPSSGSSISIYQAYGVQLIGGATSITVTINSSAFFLFHAEEFSGGAALNASIFDNVSSSTNTGTNLSVPVLTSSEVGELIIATVAANGNATWTAGTGYTLYGPANPTRQKGMYKLSGTISETAPATISVSDVWEEIVRSYKLPDNAGKTINKNLSDSVALSDSTPLNIAAVQTSAQTGVITGSSANITLLPTTLNNLVVVHIRIVTTSITVTSVTDDKGNTYAISSPLDSSSNNIRIYQAYGVQTTSGTTTVTVNFSSSVLYDCGADEFSGTAITNASTFDTSTTAIGSGTNLAVSTLTPATTGELVVVTIASDLIAVGTAGTSYTLYNGSTNNVVLHSEYRLVGASTETAPFTLSTSRVWDEIATAFKPLLVTPKTVTSFHLSLSDSVTTTDSITSKAISITKSDSVTLSDSASITTSISKSDSISAFDGTLNSILPIQTATQVSGTLPSPATVTISPTGAGNLVVVHFRSGSVNVTSVTDDKSNTYVLSAKLSHASGFEIYQAYGVQITGGATIISVNYASTTSIVIGVDEYSGTELTNSKAFNSQATGNSHGATTSVSAISLIRSGELIVATIGHPSNNQITAGSGYVRYSNGVGLGNNSTLHSEYNLSSTTSETAPSTLGFTDDWLEIATAFNPIILVGKTINKNLADSVTTSDNITSKIIEPVIADSVTTSDNLSSYFLRTLSLSDYVNATDGTEDKFNGGALGTNTFGQPYFGGVTSTIEGITKTISIIETDSVTLTDFDVENISGSLTQSLSDTVILSDSIAKTAEPVESDSLTASDSRVCSVNPTKTDSVTSTDAISKADNIVESDTITSSDSRTDAISISKSDSITTSDSISKTDNIAESDNITLSDVFSRVVSYNLSLSDSIILTDSISKADSIVKSDSIILSDNEANTVGLSKSDSITASDSSSNTIGLNKADNISTSDAVSKADSIVRSDSIILTDNFSDVASFNRTFTDSVTLIDSEANTTNISESDNVSTSDSISKQPILVESDIITLSDAIIEADTHVITLSDSVTLSDVITKTAELVLNDSVTTSDIFDRVVSYNISLSDTITLTDSIAKTDNITESDSVTASDSISKTSNSTQADSITVSDSAINTVGLNKTDSVSTLDAVSKTDNIVKSDTLTPSDNFSDIASFLRTFTDSATLSDSNANTISHPTSDSTTTSDAISKQPQIVESDSVTLSDAIVESDVHVLNLSDSVSLTDNLIKDTSIVEVDNITTTDSNSKAISTAITDFVNATDVISKTFSPATINDSVTISDVQNNSIGKNSSDSVTTSDNTSKSIGLNKNDNLTSVDELLNSIFIAESDNLTLTDAESNTIKLKENDSVSLSDSRNNQIGLSASDIITANDSLIKYFAQEQADAVILIDFFSANDSLRLSLSDFITLTDNTQTVTDYKLSIASVCITTDSNGKITSKTTTDSVTLNDLITPNLVRGNNSNFFLFMN